MTAFLKFTLSLIKNNLGSFILLYILVPVLLVFYMSSVNPDSVQNSIKSPKHSVRLIDNDKTLGSEALISIFKSKEMSEIIELSEKEKPEYTITIPKGYQDSIEKDTQVELLIKAKKNSSSLYLNSLTAIIKNVNNRFVKSYLVNKQIMQIAKKDIKKSKSVEKEYMQLQKEINKPLNKIEFIEEKTKLSTKSKYAIIFISFLFFSFLLEPLQASIKKKTNGLNMRINSLALKPYYIFISSAFATATKFFISIVIYMLIFKSLNIAFLGYPAILILYAVLISFTTGAIAEFFMTFKNKEITSIILTIIFMLTAVFGNMIAPSIENKKIANLLDFNPIKILYDPLLKFYMGSSNLEVVKSFIVLFVTGSIFLILGITISSLKKNRV